MAASSEIITGVLAVALSLGAAGCAARAKGTSATPAPAKPSAPSASAAPQPLSVPQTQVDLPRPQPVDPAALATETVAPPPVEAPPAPHPAPPARRTTPRPEPATPTPPVAAPEAPPREPVQEIVSQADLKRYQESAQNRKREVARILDALKTRHLSKAQQNVLSSIRSFVGLSDEAEKRNEMRQADVLAERAQILARDLQNGK